MTLAFSSPDVCCIALSLHSAHLFRGRAERRDSVLRAAGHRLAQRNRCVALRSKLCRALMLQGLRFLRYGCVIKPRLLLLAARHNKQACSALARCVGFRRLRRVLRSRLRCRLQSRRLHSLTQVPSAGPARTCKGCGHGTFIRCIVQEPERPSSLAPSFSRPAPVAPIGLPAQLFRASAVTADAVTPAVRKSSSDRLNVRFSVVGNGSVLARSKGCQSKYIYSRWSRSSCAPELRLSR